MTELSPEEHDAIAHWAAYGRPGEPGPERYVPNDAYRATLHDFVAPATGLWAILFGPMQTEVLLRGFHPEEMEDKWVVYSDDPSGDGTTSIHFHRSWTGNKIIQVDLELTATGSRCVGATWEMDGEIVKGASEEFARQTFVEVCRWVLRMPIEPEGDAG